MRQGSYRFERLVEEEKSHIPVVIDGWRDHREVRMCHSALNAPRFDILGKVDPPSHLLH